MSQKKIATIFTKQNYMWMAIGGAVIVLGFLLMIGGKSADPNVFNKDETHLENGTFMIMQAWDHLVFERK